MRKDEKLTNYECICLFALRFLFSLFNDFFSILVRFAGTSAWISQIIGAALSLFQLAIFIVLLKRHSGRDLLEIFQDVFGTVVGRIFAFAFFVYLIFHGVISLEQLADFLKIYTYSTINPLYNGIIIMFTVGIFARYSIKGIAKTTSIFFPLIIGVWLLILVLGYQQYDPDLIHPIMGYGGGTTLNAGIQLITEYSSIFILGIFGNAFGGHKRFKKFALIGTGIAAVIFTLTTLCFTMALPYSSVKESTSGIIWMAQSTYNSRFLQKTESMFIAITITAVLLILGMTFLTIQKIYCHIFYIKKEHTAATVVPLSAIMLVLMRYMISDAKFSHLVINIRRIGAFVCLGIIVFTLIVSILKERIGKIKKYKFINKSISMIIILVSILVLFTGCNTENEPDSNIYPIIVGFDKGKKEKYSITMKFMEVSPKDGSGEKSTESEDGEDQGGVPPGVMVLESPNVNEAVNNAIAVLPKKISFLQVKMLIISEELAKEGIGEFIYNVSSYTEIKPTVSIVVSKCDAYDLIVVEGSEMTNSLPMDIEMILEPNKKSTVYVVQSLANFYSSCMSTYGDGFTLYGNVNQNNYKDRQKDGEKPPELIGHTDGDSNYGFLPGSLPIMGNSEMEIAGAAVFRADKMVGSLTTKECETLSVMNDNNKVTTITFKDLEEPEDYVNVIFRKSMPTQYKTYITEDGQTHIKGEIHIEATLAGAQNYKVNYSKDFDKREQLRLYVQDEMNRRSNSLVEKLQKEYDADIMQIGRRVARNFKTIQEWEEYNWFSKFQVADINFEYTINL